VAVDNHVRHLVVVAQYVDFAVAQRRFADLKCGISDLCK